MEKSNSFIDNNQNEEMFKDNVIPVNDISIPKKYYKYILLLYSLLFAIILLLFVLIVLVLVNKGSNTKNQDNEMFDVSKVFKKGSDPEDPDDSFYEFNRITKVDFPFALHFTYGNSPQKKFSALEQSPYTLAETLNDILIEKEIYSSSIERNIDIATGIHSFSSLETKKQLVSSIISIDHFDNTFKETVQKQLFKGFVTFNIKRQRIKVDRSQVTVSQLYLRQITQILNSTLDHDTKVNKLFSVFQNYGYFIPLQVVLGGRIDLLFEEISEGSAETLAFKFKEEIDFLSEDVISAKKEEDKVKASQTVFSYHSTLDIRTLGGKVENITEINTVKGIEKWYNSLREENYNIIAYEEIVPITNFFPQKTKKLYEEFEKDIDNKFYAIYDKYQLLKTASNQKILTEGENGKEWSCGAQESDSQVKKIRKEIFVDWKLGRTSEYNFSECPGANKYIVGFKIKENRGDSNNGKWELQGDKGTIIRDSIEIKFTSKRNYEQKWIVEIYYVDLKV